jgi:hypothetical protein
VASEQQEEEMVASNTTLPNKGSLSLQTSSKMDIKRPKTSHTTYPVVDELWTMVKITPSGGEEV